MPADRALVRCGRFYPSSDVCNGDCQSQYECEHHSYILRDLSYVSLPPVETVTDACFSGRCRYCERLTGMDILAAYFLLPIGIVVYVVFGGLRATFMYD
ncbi:hypothetical protein C8R48DRAFT_732615 [Suillus tomentosus]|nr:hypothetical protein C8R48DRAFT_732615 [Suillus tomentosus]